MPLGAQPKRARGTIERPYSALNLRLALASFGLVASTVLAVLSWRAGYLAVAWALIVLAVITVVDLVVIQLRRRQRRGEHHSLFE